MLHRLYPWKLFKDIEDVIIDRRTGPEFASSPSRLFTSDAPRRAAIGDPIRSPSAPQIEGTCSLPAVSNNVPPGPDSSITASNLHLQAHDNQMHRPWSAPPQTNFLQSDVQDQPVSIPKTSPDYPPATTVHFSPPSSSNSSANTASSIMNKPITSRLHSPPNRTGVSISAFERASDFTINDSLVNNVAGDFNPTIFKFDGGEEAFSYC